MKKMFLFAAAMCCLTACSGKSVYSGFHEINEISLVQTIGIDEQDGEIVLTLASGAPMEDQPVTVIKNSAKTISRALEEAQKSNATEKYLSFAHVQHILIGEKAAESFYRYLDYPERLMSMRLDVNVYIVHKGTAEEMVTGAIGKGIGISQLLDSFVESSDLLSDAHVFTLGEVANSLAKNGNALVAKVRFADKEEMLSGQTEKVVTAAGYAVIKDGRIMDSLSWECTRGVNVLLNHFSADLVEIDDREGGYAGIYLSSSKCKYEPVFQEGVLKHVNVNVKMTGNIQELQNPIDIYEAEVLSYLKEQVSLLEEQRIRTAIEKSRELACDIMDLGGQVERKSPVQFSKMSTGWDTLFPEVQFNINVDVKLERTYDIGRPLDYTGGGK